jgi:hypothetical protein
MKRCEPHCAFFVAVVKKSHVHPFWPPQHDFNRHMFPRVLSTCQGSSTLVGECFIPGSLWPGPNSLVPGPLWSGCRAKEGKKKKEKKRKAIPFPRLHCYCIHTYQSETCRQTVSTSHVSTLSLPCTSSDSDSCMFLMMFGMVALHGDDSRT